MRAAALGFSPFQCIAIEDSYAGVTAANEAGYFTIAAPNNFTRGQCLSHADLIIPSFANLTLPDFEQIYAKIALFLCRYCPNEFRNCTNESDLIFSPKIT